MSGCEEGLGLGCTMQDLTSLFAGLGGLKDDEENLESEIRLLYVGMTRARQQLLLTGSGGNWFVGRLGG